MCCVHVTRSVVIIHVTYGYGWIDGFIHTHVYIYTVIYVYTPTYNNLITGGPYIARVYSTPNGVGCKYRVYQAETLVKRGIPWDKMGQTQHVFILMWQLMPIFETKLY